LRARRQLISPACDHPERVFGNFRWYLDSCSIAPRADDDAAGFLARVPKNLLSVFLACWVNEDGCLYLIFGAATLQLYERKIKGAKLSDSEGRGYLPPLENAEDTARQMADFLNS